MMPRMDERTALAAYARTAREERGMSQGPFTARDTVALEAMKARAIGMGSRVQEINPEELMAWAFAVADAFVALSTSRWAKQERSGDNEKKV